MTIILSAIGYLLLGLSALAVVLFCWLGVECRLGLRQSAHHRRTSAGARPRSPGGSWTG